MKTEPKSCKLCGDQGPLLLRARCHLTAPLAIELDGDTLIVRCYVPECGQEVARFKIVRETCQSCKDWGRTITLEENPAAIPCPKCGRLTWPNLGVNCPAGAAVSLASAATMITRKAKPTT